MKRGREKGKNVKKGQKYLRDKRVKMVEDKSNGAKNRQKGCMRNKNRHVARGAKNLIFIGRVAFCPRCIYYPGPNFSTRAFLVPSSPPYITK
jgi:hypothetical protein